MASASTPGSVPKAMSSRLLTMKFMQRAAASPTSPSPSTPDEPPNKRRKKNGDASPSPFSVDALADQRAVQKALAEEEAIRQVALERQAAEAGDTRWVLSFEDDGPQAASPIMALRVVQMGYANLDSISSHQIRTEAGEEEEPQDKPIMVGRRSFGKFNRVLEKQQDPTLEDSSDSDESENDGSEDDADGDSDDPMNNLIKTSRAEATQRLKAERKAKKKAEKSKTAELAKQRKKKAVNLNGLTSLSGSQSRSGPSGPPRGPCYSCGGPHMRAECPDTKRRYPGGDDDGRPRKSIRSR